MTTKTTASVSEIGEAAKSEIQREAKAAIERELKATAELNKAKKAAKALKEQQKRDAAKSAKREATKKDREAACHEVGFVMPQDIDKETEPTLDLCCRILEVQPWGFSYNQLAQQYEFRGKVLWPAHYGRVLTDPLMLAIRLSLVDVFGLEFSKADVEDSLKGLCYRNPYDPVVEYLTSLKWDKKRRIDGWQSTYLSAPDNEYTRAVGRLWLMAAVARAMHPGIKFDNVLILEGDQGTEKSGAFKILGGDWFSDADLGDVKNKDAAIQLQGVWIQELPELGTMRRSDLNDLKAFFSRDKDKYRAPHAKTAQTHPRRCVCGATGNTKKDRGYLVDDTGNRRYWPVTTGVIHYAKLREDRDQIWAEAVHMWTEAIQKLEPRDYRRALELPKELWAVAGEEQQARLLVDPWVEQLKPWLDDPYHQSLEKGFDGRDYSEVINPYMEDGKLVKIHSRVLMAECLRIPPGSQTREHGRRLRAVMSGVKGWNYAEQLSVGAMKGIGGYIKVREQEHAEGVTTGEGLPGRSNPSDKGCGS